MRDVSARRPRSVFVESANAYGRSTARARSKPVKRLIQLRQALFQRGFRFRNGLGRDELDVLDLYRRWAHSQ